MSPGPPVAPLRSVRRREASKVKTLAAIIGLLRKVRPRKSLPLNAKGSLRPQIALFLSGKSLLSLMQINPERGTLRLI